MKVLENVSESTRKVPKNLKQKVFGKENAKYLESTGNIPEKYQVSIIKVLVKYH